LRGFARACRFALSKLFSFPALPHVAPYCVPVVSEWCQCRPHIHLRLMAPFAKALRPQPFEEGSRLLVALQDYCVVTSPCVGLTSAARSTGLSSYCVYSSSSRLTPRCCSKAEMSNRCSKPVARTFWGSATFGGSRRYAPPTCPCPPARSRLAARLAGPAYRPSRTPAARSPGRQPR
jgi:hypothetical protein